MEQHLGIAQMRMDGLEGGIDDLRGDVVNVRNVHQIEDQPIIPVREQVFRMILGRGTPREPSAWR